MLIVSTSSKADTFKKEVWIFTSSVMFLRLVRSNWSISVTGVWCYWQLIIVIVWDTVPLFLLSFMCCVGFLQPFALSVSMLFTGVSVLACWVCFPFLPLFCRAYSVSWRHRSAFLVNSGLDPEAMITPRAHAHERHNDFPQVCLSFCPRILLICQFVCYVTIPVTLFLQYGCLGSFI